MTAVSELFDQAMGFFERGELEGVLGVLAKLQKVADASDARLRFLELMVASEEDDEFDEDPEALLEVGRALLDDATTIGEPRHALFVVLELGGLLAAAGEVDDVEHAMRALAEREDLDEESAGDARLAWASLVFEAQEDPAEALAILDEASDELRERSTYASLRAALYMELDRDDEAVELLEQALARDDETELHYQLGIVLRDLDRGEEAVEHLLTVRRRDLDDNEVDAGAPVDADEAKDLRRSLEELLETLPDPVLKAVATASIRVERWPSEDAVREGCDPRAALAFEGVVDSDDADGHVDSLVIYRDVLIGAIDFDDDIVEVFAICLAEELDRFFDLELIPGM